MGNKPATPTSTNTGDKNDVITQIGYSNTLNQRGNEIANYMSHISLTLWLLIAAILLVMIYFVVRIVNTCHNKKITRRARAIVVEYHRKQEV